MKMESPTYTRPVHTLSIKYHNPNAVEFTVGSRTWYFSYQTCVAFLDNSRDAYNGSESCFTTLHCRRQSNYSPTTAKHMSYMGVSDWPKVDNATFEKLAAGD